MFRIAMISVRITTAAGAALFIVVFLFFMALISFLIIE